MPSGIEELPSRLAGQTIAAVERRGKFIVLELERGFLAIHLGMTGKLLVDAPRSAYTHAVLTLDQGIIVYDDIRQFGKIEWSAELPTRIARLGPEPLLIPWDAFYQALHRRKTKIKPLLLNQTFVRGLGNIYVDEILFRARIHPRAVASRLSKVRVHRLYQSMVETLTLAIAHRGSSISDYVDAEGNKGGFQLLHQVYAKEGKPCGNCGAPIRRIVVAQRGTHYCPVCQRS